jgi:hypothetical protein
MCVCVVYRHTFATSQDSQIGLQQGRNHHLEEALSKTMTANGSHPEASRRAGTAYLNMHKAHTFDLTHKTGSFMYMAPEVFKERKYNEKVCIAFAVCNSKMDTACCSLCWIHMDCACGCTASHCCMHEHRHRDSSNSSPPQA